LQFQTILADLLAHVDGAVAAVFLDWEGETVELMSAHSLERDELKIMGAQQGILLRHLRRMCDTNRLGPPHRFKIEYTRATVLSCDLKDGYYVVLVVSPDSNEAIAWRWLESCRQRLLVEI
jgi:predicted regulator of Ras-like GTPase activity (Roadblock/LC7/MglB family)